MVGRRTLDAETGVRVPVRQQTVDNRGKNLYPDLTLMTSDEEDNKPLIKSSRLTLGLFDLEKWQSRKHSSKLISERTSLRNFLAVKKSTKLISFANL